MTLVEPRSPGEYAAPAFAKVNLTLAVGPPEPPASERSGFHPIVSWMACAALWDDVRVRPRPRGASDSTYRVTWEDGGPVPWPIADDLVVRAHRAIEAQLGGPAPVEIEVTKRIPAGAGLGGGSSDAATALRLIDAALGLGLDEAALRAAAGRLGSDLAFFLDLEQPAVEPPRPAVVGGFGERVRRVSPNWTAKDDGIVLILPPFACATASVYRAFDRVGVGRPFRESEAEAAASAAEFDEAGLFNDLTRAADEVEPRLAVLREELRGRLGRRVQVSGSGSALFVLGGAAVAGEVRAAAPDVRVVAARLVPSGAG